MGTPPGEPPASHRPRWQTLALAATVIVALAASAWWWLGQPSAAPIAVVETSLGAAVAETPLGASTPLEAGAVLEPGSSITTSSDARLSLRYHDVVSLRIDRGSQARLLPRRELELTRGAIYVDTGNELAGMGPETAPSRALTIRTPLGVAWDLGTRFELRLTEGGTMRIRVREGRVAVESHSQEHVASSGEQLVVANDGSATTSRIDLFGEDWTWILDLAPRLGGDRRTVGDLLDWVTRETGWQCRWQDAALESTARRRPVSGDVGRLDPERAAIVALPAAGLQATAQDGVLLIREAR